MTSATQLVSIFSEHWAIPFGILCYVLTNNCVQCLCKCFAPICGYLGFKHLKTTVCHPQTNGRVEQYSKTIFARLRHFIADHHLNWGVFVHPLTYAYNEEMQRSANTSPYSLIPNRPALGPSSLREGWKRFLPPRSNASQERMRAMLQARILVLRNETDTHLWEPQAR